MKLPGDIPDFACDVHFREESIKDAGIMLRFLFSKQFDKLQLYITVV